MLSETGEKALFNDQVSESPSIGTGPTSEYPLRPIVRAWSNKIKRALKFKKDRFQDDADEALKFYECGRGLHELMWDGAHLNTKNIWSDDDEATPAPKFRIVVGKVADLVQRFGPSIYHQNPVVRVEPKTLDIPDDKMIALIPPQLIQQAQQAAQQQGQPFTVQSLIPQDPEKPKTDVSAVTMEYLLNYMQRENDKKLHSRRMAEESIIKGLSCLWTEYTEPYPDGPRVIVSSFDSVDNLIFDPDCEQREKALWIARKRVLPVWQVAKDYDQDEAYLKKLAGIGESVNSQEEGRDNPDHQTEKAKGRTNDLLEIWEVYSKMGMGNRLSGVKDIDGIEAYLDSFGDNVHLVINEHVPFPLNLHHEKVLDVLTEPDEQQQREKYDGTFMDVQWPIPFWEFGEWPYTGLAFRESPNNSWPMPYIKPAIGYLKFINWCFSFLVNKVRTACCTVVSTMKALDEENKQRLLNGRDFRLLEFTKDQVPDGDVAKVVHFLQMPPFQQDIYNVLERVMAEFDKSTGLTSLMYGAPGGMRSSAEAQLKGAHASAPIDDMASRMEDAMALIARKEAMAARWILTAKDVEPILGELGASLWDQYVATKDFSAIAREYHYRIEAGSMRKPNKEAQANIVTQALQGWAPMIQFALAHGDVGPANMLWEKWCDANDFDPNKPLLQPPPPPPPNPEIQKIQAEIEGKKQEAQIRQQEAAMKMQTEQMKMGLEARKAQLRLGVERQKAAQELQLGQLQGQQDMALARQDAALKSQQMQTDARLKLIQGVNEMHMQRQQGEQQMHLQREQGHNQIQIQREQAAQKAAQPRPVGGGI